MSGLFSTRDPSDPRFQEGVVLSVDVDGFTCQVRTTNGRLLNQVRWLMPVGSGTGRGGDRSTPMTDERVYVSFMTGSPIIIGALGSVSASALPPVQLTTGQGLANTGDISQLNGGTSDPGRPKDLLPGDKVLSTEGGGLIAILRSGGLLMKAGGVAQLFLSKLDGFFRILARNLHILTDAHSEVSGNVGGTAYRYTGYAQTVGDARGENFLYEEYYGNIPAGTQAKGKRRNLPAKLPAPDGRMKLVTCGAMVETVTTGGVYSRFISQAQLTHDTTSWQVLTAGGPVIIRVDPDNIRVAYKENSIVLNSSGINLTSDTQITAQAPTVTMKGSGATITATDAIVVTGSSYTFS